MTTIARCTPRGDRLKLIDKTGRRFHREIIRLAVLDVTPDAQQVLHVVLCLFEHSFLRDGENKKVVGVRL